MTASTIDEVIREVDVVIAMRRVLNAREQRILIRRFWYGDLFREIAATESVSVERIRQILAAAVSKLSHCRERHRYRFPRCYAIPQWGRPICPCYLDVLS